MFTPSPLIGAKAMNALNIFQAALLALKMLPINLDITLDEFYYSFKGKSEAQRESDIRMAVSFLKLEEDELLTVVSFFKDANGIEMGRSHLKALGLKDQFEMTVSLLCEIGKIDIELISEDEKKKLKIFQST
jgi:hypothetical protein